MPYYIATQPLPTSEEGTLPINPATLGRFAAQIRLANAGYNDDARPLFALKMIQLCRFFASSPKESMEAAYGAAGMDL